MISIRPPLSPSSFIKSAPWLLLELHDMEDYYPYELMSSLLGSQVIVFKTRKHLQCIKLLSTSVASRPKAKKVMSYLKNIFFSFFNNNNKICTWRVGVEAKSNLYHVIQGWQVNYLSGLLLIFLFSLTCLYLQDQNSFQAPILHPFDISPPRPALSLWGG